MLTALRKEKHGFPHGTSAPAPAPARSARGEARLPPVSLLALRSSGRREEPYTASREASDCSVAVPALPLFLGENELGFESQGGGRSSEPRWLCAIPARPALSAAGSGTAAHFVLPHPSPGAEPLLPRTAKPRGDRGSGRGRSRRGAEGGRAAITERRALGSAAPPFRSGAVGAGGRVLTRCFRTGP